MARRLIMSATDKGGVGKSFTFIHLADWMQDSGINWHGFDPDDSNYTFSKTHPDDVTTVNIDRETSMDSVLKAFGQYDAILVDGLGAMQSKGFLRWVEEVDLFDVADEFNLSITMVLNLNSKREPLDGAHEVMQRFGEHCDYLIVKNPHELKTKVVDDSDFELWEKSAAKKLAKKLGAYEVIMPAMTHERAQHLNDHLTTAGRAYKHAESLGDLQRWKGLWLGNKAIKGFSPMFDEAEDILIP